MHENKLVDFINKHNILVKRQNKFYNLENNDNVIIKRETETGIEKLKVKLPLILGCQEPIAEWKIPNMRGIMSARTKELLIVEPVAQSSGFHYKKFNLPLKKTSIKMFSLENIASLFSFHVFK